MRSFSNYLRTSQYQPGMIPATPENQAKATRFLTEKWRERAAERKLPEPTNLQNACKFSSLFFFKLFGGRMRGNWHHQYVELRNGTILDPTDAAGVSSTVDPYRHDERFWGNREHRDSVESCESRVDRWVKEFIDGVIVGK